MFQLLQDAGAMLRAAVDGKTKDEAFRRLTGACFLLRLCVPVPVSVYARMCLPRR
jgi:hypothetical protein